MLKQLVKNKIYICLCLLLCAGALTRYRTTALPLERDEGEYAYAGSLILDGFYPYSKAYNMKFPGTYAAYALIEALLGRTAKAVRVGLIFLNALSTVFLFLLAREICDSQTCALFSAAIFILMSMGSSVQGLFANAEHFVLLPALTGLYLTITALEHGRTLLLIVSGISLGLSITMKQHGFLFLCAALALVCASRYFNAAGQSGKARVILFNLIAGACIPLAVMCLLLIHGGVFDRFRFWTFDYAVRYVSSVPLSCGIGLLRDRAWFIFREWPLVFLVLPLGLATIIVKFESKYRAYICILAIFSCLAVCPGLYFRPHYFILLLPAVSIVSAVGLTRLYNRSTALPIAVLVLSIILNRNYLFVIGPNQICRRVFGLNPFPEAVQIASFVKNNSSPCQKIAVVGSEPEIYFYSQRDSATGYIYTYALVEKHDRARAMQDEMIAEIENGKPEFLIFVNIFYSWLTRKGADLHIFEWFRSYSFENYREVGLVTLSPGGTRYYWKKIPDAARSSRLWISILRRKRDNKRSCGKNEK